MVVILVRSVEKGRKVHFRFLSGKGLKKFGGYNWVPYFVVFVTSHIVCLPGVRMGSH